MCVTSRAQVYKITYARAVYISIVIVIGERRRSRRRRRSRSRSRRRTETDPITRYATSDRVNPIVRPSTTSSDTPLFVYTLPPEGH